MSWFTTPNPTRPGAALAVVPLVAAVFALPGCTTSRTTDPPKTATELYLLSVAIDHAVEPLSGEMLRGRLVFVDRTLTPDKEQDYLVGAVRAKLLVSGARVTTMRDSAEIIVEMRTPGVGIDRTEMLIGIPGIPLGSVMSAAGIPGTSVSTPELALVKSLTQWGTAGVAYVAYWRETGELVASSGPHIGRSYREDWTFFGYSRTLSNIPATRAPDVDEQMGLDEGPEAVRTGDVTPPEFALPDDPAGPADRAPPRDPAAPVDPRPPVSPAPPVRPPEPAP